MNNLNSKIEEILEELNKAVEYHSSHDIGLNQISLIKQEIGTAILSKLPEILKQFAQHITENILVEEIKDCGKKSESEAIYYEQGFNACLQAIKAKRKELFN